MDEGPGRGCRGRDVASQPSTLALASIQLHHEGDEGHEGDEVSSSGRGTRAWVPGPRRS